MRFFFFVSLSPFANTFCGEKREKRDERMREVREIISLLCEMFDRISEISKEQIHRSIFFYRDD